MELIVTILKEACFELLEKDELLFDTHINERALTHRLAVYLEQLLPNEYKKQDYTVDCEYNRDGFAKKAIRYDGDNEDYSIYPDIIIHQRCSIGNLLIIEAKKDAHKIDFKNDTQKLRQYCREYHYEYAFFLNFLTNEEKIEIYLLNQENWILEIK